MVVVSFIHSGYFYSASSSPLLLGGAPDYSTDTVSELACWRATVGKCERRTCPRSLRGSWSGIRTCDPLGTRHHSLPLSHQAPHVYVESMVKLYFCKWLLQTWQQTNPVWEIEFEEKCKINKVSFEHKPEGCKRLDFGIKEPDNLTCHPGFTAHPRKR